MLEFNFLYICQKLTSVELAIYIKELLYKNDHLIIPGIGVFHTNYRAADINIEDHTISPPMKYLMFDANYSLSDDVLVNYILQQKKGTKKNTEKFVKHQVDDLIKKLNKGETILLEGIGYFSKNQDVIRFDREHESNFLTESYGLSKIDYKPLDGLLKSNQSSASSSKKFKESYRTLLIFIVLVLLIGGVLAVYFYMPNLKSWFFSGKQISKVTVIHKNNIIPIVKKEPDSSAKPIVKQKVASDTSKLSDLEKFFNNKTDKKIALAIDSVREVKPSTGKSFFIIAGSFKTYKRATIQAKILQKEGFKTEILQFSEDLYRVSLGEYGEKDEALAECDKIRSTKGIASVWLLSK